IALNGVPTGTVIVTPHSDKAGTFSPATLSYTGSGAGQTCAFTPTVSGVHSISTTNNGGLTNATPFNYTVQPAISGKLVADDDDSTPRASLSNLLIAFWDQVGPYAKLTHTPTDGSNVLTTNG